MLSVILSLLAAPAVTPGQIHRLERERKAMFLATVNRRNSGYLSGAEGSDHDAIFIVGRSSPIYYYSFFVPYGDETSPPKTYAIELTRWDRTRKGFRKTWQVRFPLARKSHSEPGALAHVVYGTALGFGNGTAVCAARPRFLPKEIGREISAVQPLVFYHFGIHGDVGAQKRVSVTDGNAAELERNWIPTVDRNYSPVGEEAYGPEATFIVLPVERMLMAAGKRQWPAILARLPRLPN